MAKSLAVWKNKVLTGSYKTDLDNSSYDCVDVPKDWGQYLFDLPWQTCCGWGNAKDLYANWPSKYWEKIPRGNRAKLGDAVVMNGQIGGGYGHTGVVVGIDGDNIIIAQQNTFTQQAVYLGTYNMYVSYITGFMRPRVAFTTGDQPLQPYQRVASYAAKYRAAPDDDAQLLQTFVAGDTYDFKGFVHGENVDGNDVWFVGRYTGGYVWSGAFTDTGTHDLPDMTEASKPLESYQRRVGNSVINYRKKPELMPDNVIKTFGPGEVLDFDAWTHGATVDGNDVWFRGRYTGGWSHSGGFTNQGTDGLTEVRLEVVPVPTDPGTPTTPTTPSTDFSNKVIDISSHNPVKSYEAIKAAVRGVIAKAGHTGVSYGGVQPRNSDPTFAANKAGLGDKLVGAYWYAYCSLDPEVEAKAFVETVGAVPANFTYWLDIEEFDGKSAAEVNAWCLKFLLKVDALTNKVTGIYCNRNWYTNTITAETKTTRPIWLAHYGTAEMSNPVANQVAHQYTSTQRNVPGFDATEDIDVNAVTDAFFMPTVIVPTPTPVDPTTPTEPTPVPGTDPYQLLIAKWVAVGKRAGKTFVQTFIATFSLGIAGVVDVNTAKVLAIAALTAAASAAWNIIKTPPEAEAVPPKV